MCTDSLSHGRRHTEPGMGGKTKVRPKPKRSRTTPRPRSQKSKGDEAGPPARSLPGGGFCQPGKTLAVAARPTPTERATLESTAPKGQGFGRYPRGGKQIFVKTFKIRCTL